ncbi:hypothetical protein GCM10025762_15190 [Haloechinothrix salitolerans]
MPHIRTVKTASGARAVQIVYSRRTGSRRIEHIGSAHDDAELELLKAAARQRMVAGQGELDLGLNAPPEAGGPLPITASRMGHLWDALAHVYDALGFDVAADGDEVFRCLVLARIVEPTSKLDSLRVLEEIGIGPPSYATVKRRLPAYAQDEWRERLAALCAHHVGLGPATLLLYDVTTLYFEADTGDGFRESGFSNYAVVSVMPRWLALWGVRAGHRAGRARPARHNPRGASHGVPVWWCSGWPIRRRNTWTR